MTSTSSLAGKLVLATGGSRGQLSIRSGRRRCARSELRDNGCAASAFPAGVSDVAQTHELGGSVVFEFGGLDLLVSNAGVEHFGALGQIERLGRAIAPEEYRSVLLNRQDDAPLDGLEELVVALHDIDPTGN